MEFQTSLNAVTLAANYDERGKKADSFKVPPQFIGVPDLAVFGSSAFLVPGWELISLRRCRRAGSVASDIVRFLFRRIR